MLTILKRKGEEIVKDGKARETHMPKNILRVNNKKKEVINSIIMKV